MSMKDSGYSRPIACEVCRRGFFAWMDKRRGTPEEFEEHVWTWVVRLGFVEIAGKVYCDEHGASAPRKDKP